MDAQFNDLKKDMEEKSMELNRLRRQLYKFGTELEATCRQVASNEMQIEKQVANYFSTLKKCRLEEIDLPLSKGKLEDIDVSQDSSAQQEAAIRMLKDFIAQQGLKRGKESMERDAETEKRGKKKVEKIRPFPVSPLYSSLSAAAKNVESIMEYEKNFQEKLDSVTKQLEEITPNLRAIDK